ncbi:MAG: VOC family protein [Rhizobiaceae bacterium]|nr:VOC family protein [Rhizobiaceae bacterium]
MTKLTPRNIDHVVLPVPSLKVARQRLTALGFTVAPDARHKFGSENACVFFENGTFIEPIAIGHRETVEAAIDKGNPFLRRDMAYRFRNGDDGFTYLVFGEPDPRKERKNIKKAGWQTGKLVTVRRPGVAVKVAMGIDERSPDFACFLCERPDGPPTFPSELTKHANGATGITRVTLCEQLPEDFQYYLQTMSGQREIRSHSFGMEFTLPNGKVSALNSAGLKQHYGVDAATERGMKAVAFDVLVKDQAKVADQLSDAGIETRKVGQRLIVDPASGQGAMIAFVEG